ncbi:hypothetical protein SRHO_G00004290 [Serrasalmus rhombeus]
MAARAHAVAFLSPNGMVFLYFLSCKLQGFCTSSSSLPVSKRTYSREFLLNIGRTSLLELQHKEEVRVCGLLRSPAPTPPLTPASRPEWRCHERRERKQNRETWLSSNVLDHTIQLKQLICYRADRALIAGAKTRGGVLCVYINDAWCCDAAVVCKHYSLLVEFMAIKCRPFYIPSEFTAIIIVIVYIPPSSNNNNNRSEALNELY